MPNRPSSIEITQHAVDRYGRLVLTGDRRVGSDARREIGALVDSGTATAAPSWLPPVERPTDTRRYVAFGGERALVLNRQPTADGGDRIVVLSVIAVPAAGTKGA